MPHYFGKQVNYTSSQPSLLAIYKEVFLNLLCLFNYADNAADPVDAAATVVNVAAATTSATQCLIILESRLTKHLHNRHFWQCIL